MNITLVHHDVKRRYDFSECIAAIAQAAYAKGVGDEQSADESRVLFAKCLDSYRENFKKTSKCLTL